MVVEDAMLVNIVEVCYDMVWISNSPVFLRI